MRRIAFALTFALGTFGLSGCYSAPDACDDLLLELCGKLVECGVPLDKSCAELVAEDDTCDRALGVSADYDACLEGIGALQCNNVLAGAGAPDICDGAVAFPASITGPRRFDVFRPTVGLSAGASQ